MLPATQIADEQKPIYQAGEQEVGKSWYCLECGALLGYTQRKLITVHTSDAAQPLGQRTITRRVKALQRIGLRGEKGDLIIGDADIRCGVCGIETRWDYRK